MNTISTFSTCLFKDRTKDQKLLRFQFARLTQEPGAPYPQAPLEIGLMQMEIRLIDSPGLRSFNGTDEELVF